MSRSVLIGLIGVVAIGLALALTFWRDAEDERALNAQPQSAPSAAEAKPEAAEPKSENAAKAPAPTEERAEPKPAPLILPSFDVVRVNPEGDAVVAGRAAPGAKVTVMDGDVAVGTVTADRNGQWVLVPEKPLPSGNRVLNIIAEGAEGQRLRSADVVVLAVPESMAQPEMPLAVLVPREGKDTKKILQRPKRQDPASRTISLQLDVVDYDEAGRLRLLGQANPGNTTIVYLNNGSIGRAEVAEDGQWELRPASPVEPGLYTLRVDELNVSKVVARIELPFSRAAPIAELKHEDYVIVQPGNSLWRISRRLLGQGTMFSVIYEANKNQIRDADLIYPGQVFAIPKTN